MASDITKQNIAELLAELPEGAEVVAAAKTRTPEEVLEAVQAGIKIIGENYVKEAKEAYELVGRRAEWHFIGTFRRHSVRRKALEIFDMIESVDSLEIATEIDRRCAQIGKIMPILIEVNSGREPQKSGVLPEDVEQLVRRISDLRNIKVTGLMTMGPRFGNPEDSRPYFVETKRIFDRIKGQNRHQDIWRKRSGIAVDVSNLSIEDDELSYLEARPIPILWQQRRERCPHSVTRFLPRSKE